MLSAASTDLIEMTRAEARLDSMSDRNNHSPPWGPCRLYCPVRPSGLSSSKKR